jgi:hypothetical protein
MSNEKLVGVGRTGDFVHNSQEMAKSQGFKNVSKLWWDKTVPLSAGIDKFVDSAKRREDIECKLSDMQPMVNADGRFVLEYVDGREFVPTQHALCHIFTQLARTPIGFAKWISEDVDVPGFKYKRDRLDNETLYTVVKNSYRRIDKNKVYKFRTYNDGTLRAMFTARYTYINNVWYLETLEKLFKEIGGVEPRLSHYDRCTDDTIYGNILIPDSVREDSDGDYGGMISVSNCEIGKRVLSQYPSLFRAICMNGCIWDQAKGNIIKQVHKGEIDYADLTQRIVANIHKQIPLINDAVERFLKTKEMKIGKVSLANVFAQIGLDNKLTPKINRQIVTEFTTHEADNANMFGVINSITRAGQHKDFNQDIWVDMDNIGGSIMMMNANRWENFLTRANALSKEQIEEAYGVAV